MAAGGTFAERGGAVARGAGLRLGGALIASVAVHAAFAAAWIALRETPPAPLGTVAVEIVAATAALGDGEPPGRPTAGDRMAAAPVSDPAPDSGGPRSDPRPRPAATAPSEPPPPLPRVKPTPRTTSLPSPPPAGDRRAEAAAVETAALDPAARAAAGAAPGAVAREPAALGGAEPGVGGAGATQPGFSPGTAANPLPSYPLAARRQGLEGRVLLRVEVDASGRPTAVAVQDGSGHGILDRAASRAVSGWRFTPATHGGRPAAGTVEVPILFRLTG